jgi:hypothetical protein
MGTMEHKKDLLVWDLRDSGAHTKLHMTGAMDRLKECLAETGKQFKVGVSVTDPYFWMTDQERAGLTGAVGAYGCTGPPGLSGPAYKNPLGSAQGDKRPLEPPSRMEITVAFKVIQPLAKAMEGWLDLKLTKNPRKERIKLLTFSQHTESVAVTMGSYMKEGAWEAYDAMKKVDSTLTLVEFVEKNEASVLRTDLWHDGRDLFKEYVEYSELPTGYVDVKFRILASDLEPNLEEVEHFFGKCLAKNMV